MRKWKTNEKAQSSETEQGGKKWRRFTYMRAMNTNYSNEMSLKEDMYRWKLE